MVNGQVYGETPIELRLPLGSYAVTWRLTGYQEVEQSLLVDGSRADQGVISQHQELARAALETTAITRNRDWTPVEQDFNGTTMVLVPAGSFEMESNDGNSDEHPRIQQT